ncbi:hypothetical protein OS493_020588 [Desmophyllum pertusum]|uniref:Uncharacterized protein n=1 Tax=Desmophyllum pertusum TaxID=174260 RepID=A0A9X0CQX1_9CNID|nr:hypothetical protein OS493_020588 [Desmophyllum pertusum]
MSQCWSWVVLCTIGVAMEPRPAGESSLSSSQDFLYLFVLEDYLSFFLPSDGSPILPANLKTKPSVGSVRKPASW